MRQPSTRRFHLSRLPVLLAAFGTALTLSLGLFAPFFTSVASANPGDNQPDASEIVLEYGGTSFTCQASVLNTQVTGPLLDGMIWDQSSAAIPNPGNLLTSKKVTTYIGVKGRNSSSDFVNSWPNHFVDAAQLDHALALGATNQLAPIITFFPATNPNPIGPFDSNGLCFKLPGMVQVSNNEWRGFENNDGITNDPKNCGGNVSDDASGTTLVPYCHGFLRFVTSSNTPITQPDGLQVIQGTMIEAGNQRASKTVCSGGGKGGQQCSQVPDDTPAQSVGSFKVLVGGTVSPPGLTNVGSVSIEWLDASQIKILSTTLKGPGTGNDPVVGEIYQKPTWSDNASDDGTTHSAVYLLAAAPNSAPADRKTLTGAGRCENPYPPGKTVCGAQDNCTPYIAIDDNIGFDPVAAAKAHSLGTFNSAVSKLGAATGTLVNYDTNCKIDGTYSLSLDNFQPAFGTWFYYSKAQKSFVVIFTNTGADEAPYVGVYTLQKNGQYTGGDNNCSGAINVDPSVDVTKVNVNSRFLVHWVLNGAGCATISTTGVGVYALFNEDDFTATAATAPTVDGGTDAATNTPDIICRVAVGDVFSWFACPALTAMQKAAGWFDDEINSQLTTDISTMFGDKNDTSKAYHTAWGSFRVIALSIIVIAGLIMVISQALDVPLLDAYTIKKIFPKLLIAAIGITISWSLLQFFTQLSNDLGNGIRSVIYHPFNALTVNGQALKNQIGGGSSFVLTLLTTGGILAFGVAGLLSFVLTALLGALIGFVMVVFRQVLLIFLIITAPLAIAFWILGHKLWKLWYDAILGVWLVFLFISAFIAIGRVFSVISFNNNGTVSQIIGIIAYFAPYFLIPLAWRVAGGAIATVGGLVNDRSKGGFDRLRNFRGNQVKKRGKKMQEGTLANGRGRIATGFNNLTRGVANAPKLGANPARWRGRMNNALTEQSYQSSKELRERDAAFATISQDEDLLRVARDARSGGDVTRMLTAAGRNTAEDHAKVEAVMRAGNRDAVRIAAATQLAATGTGYEDSGQMLASIADVAGDDLGLGTRMLGDARKAASDARAVHLSGAGFGRTNTELHAIMGTAPGAARATRAAAATQALNHEALQGTGAYQVIGARRNAVEALAPQMVQDVNDALLTGNQDQIDEALAGISARHTAMTSASPENAQVMAQQVMSAGVQDPANGQWVTVRELIDRARNRPPNPAHGQQRFLEMERNYTNAYQQNQQQQQQQQNLGSDRRIKTDIVPTGTFTPQGFPFYSFRYIGDTQQYVGVMAQDILPFMPEAITTEANGYYSVNYGLLGIQMLTYDEWLTEQHAPTHALS
ncbi:MAG TPA: tail fiber domain-containing protein [Patescibacteria group bacterium]|nr:tail fiber domain-containing protein [Patescibacteria group bacterium]